MSHKPATMGVLEELNGQLSESAKAALIRIARRVAGGYEGVVELTIGKGGGIRFVKWTQLEDGATIREELG